MFPVFENRADAYLYLKKRAVGECTCLVANLDPRHRECPVIVRFLLQPSFYLIEVGHLLPTTRSAARQGEARAYTSL